MAAETLTLRLPLQISASNNTREVCKPLCKSMSCPVSGEHYQGLYLHEEPIRLTRACARLFQPSIPPPDVAKAYGKSLCQEASKEDEEIVAAFHELHTEPLIDEKMLRWVAPLPLRVDFDADRITPVFRNHGPRHPFGFSNPPDSIWRAFSQMKAGKATLWEKNVVEVFSPTNAFIGVGNGCDTSALVGRRKNTMVEKRISRYMKTEARRNGRSIQ
ncbi:uncharacterized protein KY384_006968 [Bacidia gigantensis]|uniref:uncharacterized protein n=1 Tax=Bacidia gigantensis TaxID=2732470 RepID=UPI001D04F351|nr:uncharacterized protein KY384_006968 [Bacidia gigantensis]KAG8528052.1 hypothetical protein KY384_006968 [Bacidia gigantensis]